MILYFDTIQDKPKNASFLPMYLPNMTYLYLFLT